MSEDFMIIVTGGAGFIGSNIIKQLNKNGYQEIIVVDDLSDGRKYVNLVGLQIADYLDKDDFLNRILTKQDLLPVIKCVFHQGACSASTEWNGRLMMNTNYEYSKELLHYCLNRQIPFIYASSASVYGGNQIFKENIDYEASLNLYGYSKWQFDQYVRRRFSPVNSQVVGLRYFNVYGPGEQHKDEMASVAFKLHQQMKRHGVVKLFSGSGGYGNGEQRRDFVFVDDVVKVNLWFMQHQEKSGIYNVGTGRSQSFNEVATAVIDWHGHGKLEYIPFPEQLMSHYQHFTEADISALREVGYKENFLPMNAGVKKYLDQLNERICVNL